MRINIGEKNGWGGGVHGARGNRLSPTMKWSGPMLINKGWLQIREFLNKG